MPGKRGGSTRSTGSTRQGEPAFSNAAFEKATGARATFRGMPMVVKLAARLVWDEEGVGGLPVGP
jgi:hypothetical protein